jgi:monofunctional biosynthetic peptidoglycan transglycosylase
MPTKRHPVIAGLILIALWSALIWVIARSLPDVRPLKNPQYTMTLMVRDATGKKVPFVVGPRNPYWTPFSRIPSALQWAVIVAEDDTFYQHNGFNFSAMRDALWENIKRRKPIRGGSTITQQLAKNLYLSREKSLSRKLKEAVITCKLERHLSKNRIIELYVNVIEWGPGVYGLGAASWHYFRKAPADLNFFESVLLAAIIPSPTLYNPYRYPERALKRYKKVLSLMLISKLITADQYEIASTVQLHVDPLDNTLFIFPLWEDEETRGREGNEGGRGKEKNEARDGAASSPYDPL